MKPKFSFKSLFFVLFLYLSTPAQNFSPEIQKEIDSLKKVLSENRYDTASVRIRYLLGLKSSISRISYWDSVVNDAHRLNFLLYEGRSLNTLGYQCRMQNQDAKAIVSLNKCYSIAEKIGNKPGMIPPLLNLSSLSLMHNDIKKSLNYCYKALKIAEEIKDQNKIALINGEIGNCYFSLGEYEKALKAHLRCCELFDNAGNDERKAYILLAIGNDYVNLKDTLAGTTYYLKTKKYSDAFGDCLTAVEINNSVASAFVLRWQFDSALIYAKKAYSMSQRLNSKQAMVSSMNILSNIYFHLKKYDQAESIVREAIAISTSLNFVLQIPSLADVLKKICIKNHDYKGAFEASELYRRTQDSLSQINIQKQAAEKEFNYNLEKKENENKLLSQQNKIQSLQLTQNRLMTLGLVSLLTLVLLVAILLIRQGRLSARQKSTQLEQKLLRSQMNPHFIFNSLQSIQNFILKHDEKAAIKYLSSFANVTRNVLENSRMEFIPLNKEIRLLENYLQLQKLRFNELFEYEISVDENIDTSTLSIPPMLAQPFVENAVEHGMRTLEAGGKIKASYRIDNACLVMEISDNGNGFDAAKKNNDDHHSLAIEITRERIDLINLKAKKKIIYSVSALYPDRPSQKGVLVTFKIPLMLLSPLPH